MKTSISSSRLSTNLNLTEFTGSHYEGLSVQVDKGPFVLEYLVRVHETIQRALTDHPRLLAIRFDLRYAHHQVLPDDAATSSVIQRFVDSLKAKIKHDRYRAGENNKRVHGTVVRYVWVKEYGVEGRPHYHFLLLLNKDAYHALGQYSSEHQNMYRRIASAWASALGLTPGEAIGLVHIPKNPTYRINSREGSDVLADLFYRVSYMCKVKTKRYGDWEHAFGCSRS